MNSNMDRLRLFEYMKDFYSVEPDYPWEKTPDACVFRHSNNSKWFALLMTVSKSKLGFSQNTNVDILNLKCDPVLIGSVVDNKCCFPAYHMNKEHWISVLLSDIPEENLYDLIDLSYNLTMKK